MKVMKICLFLLTACLSGGALLAQGSSQQITIPLSEPGKPYTLDAHLFHGFVKVSAYDGKDIVVDLIADSGRPEKLLVIDGMRKNGKDNVVGMIEDSGRPESPAAGGMRKIGGGSFDFDAQEDHNNVTLSASQSHSLRGIRVKVPRTGGKLMLGSVENNGTGVTVDGVSGELEVNCVNGDVLLTDISGSAVVSTVNGRIKASFKSVKAETPMAFSNVSGLIDVTFPADQKANIKLKTDQGEIYTDFDAVIDKVQPKVITTTPDDGRSHHISRTSIENWVTGKINGGGPEIMMKTLSGNIFIRKAKQ